MYTQIEGSVDRLGAAVGQESPQNDLKRKASAPATKVTLRPPTLEKDGTAVTGALKHHLKKQKKG